MGKLGVIEALEFLFNAGAKNDNLRDNGGNFARNFPNSLLFVLRNGVIALRE